MHVAVSGVEDEEVGLADVEQGGDVFGADHMPAPERGLLAAARNDAGDVMAQHRADGVFNGNGFHARPFLPLIRVCFCPRRTVTSHIFRQKEGQKAAWREKTDRNVRRVAPFLD